MVQYVLAVVGGKGLCVGCKLLEQFLPMGGELVLMRATEAFYAYNAEIRIILVLPYSQQSYWNELYREHHSLIPHHVANGGRIRFHSMKNELASVTTPGLVGVHDGVRPFVTQEVIARYYSSVVEKQMVVPVTDAVEAVRRSVGEGGETISRDEYKLAQTPQVLDANLLKQAYEQPYISHSIDDASVIEALGKSVYLTEGNRENIEITTPFDLKVATVLLESCPI